ncbi:MAG: uroporphyrinogen-III C-methyltransferase [Woeseiaceae bacterium]|nr:uroporphyrinogen-III C-methyltransferase [Woeseiaceae bacterium]
MSKEKKPDKDAETGGEALPDVVPERNEAARLGAEDPDAPADDDAEGGGEPAPDAAGPGAISPAPAGNRSGAVAWLALFIALVAAAAVGYSIVEDWRAARSAAAESRDLAGSVARVRDQLAEAESGIAALESTAGELVAADDRLASELTRLETQLAAKLDLVESLPARMSSLESSMAALQGISAGARETWLIAEAEYYMQLANAQLQLARNPELALLALGMADERVRQLSNPRLIDVRRALADELAALEAMDKPDIEGATLTLASLARVVDSLPLAQRGGAGRDEGVDLPEDAGGFARFWSGVKGAFSSAVRITPPDRAEMPFLAPEAETFLRTNLALKLQAARLALLRGEQAVFEQSLEDAADWLESYFDTGSTQVASALETIREIRANVFTIDPPDISDSLRLLRQYRTLSESEQ